ncbi:MAG TPA: hypothetical protein VED40_15335 [Azospirillaceae bacterium]|nr:hypothetical protein [Azospirillaceae bacterium]
MRKTILIAAGAAALLSGCATPVKTVQSLPADRIAEFAVADVGVELAVQEARATLPEKLKAALNTTLPGCAKGTVPVKMTVRVDSYKEQDGLKTILIGDMTQLAGLVKFIDPKDGTVLGEYFVDQMQGGGGLLGMAIMADAETKLSQGFADQVCKEVFKKKA